MAGPPHRRPPRGHHVPPPPRRPPGGPPRPRLPPDPAARTRPRPPPTSRPRAATARPRPRRYPHLLLGNPSEATEDPKEKDNFLVKKPYFALSYNSSKGTPNWVSWRVTKADLGEAPRKLQFDIDPDLPRGFRHVAHKDYNGSRVRPRPYVPALGPGGRQGHELRHVRHVQRRPPGPEAQPEGVGGRGGVPPAARPQGPPAVRRGRPGGQGRGRARRGRRTRSPAARWSCRPSAGRWPWCCPAEHRDDDPATT